MEPALKKEQVEAWRLFLEAHASLTRTLERELMEEHKLPLTWYDVLVQLEEAGGHLRMHELADRLLLSRSATTRFVERLESRELIERRACSEDRRGTYVVLTTVGKDALRSASPIHLAGVEEHFAERLTESDTRAMIRALTKLVS
ncbi:MAG: MarR family transcriptional regulator [Acidimicrobiia bacterium]|nr:MarR family transcriptional regulator [Acidimicrobiia bacterium]MDH3397853.1 MarR family transcriptional regulator [Acidimicrobiia bacterium]